MTRRWLGLMRTAVLIGSTMLACALPVQAGPIVEGHPSLRCDPEARLAPAWRNYSNLEHGFSIAYPSNWRPVEPGDARVAAGAVVSFVPVKDCTSDASGRKTNLIEVSVTVAVTGASGDTGTGDRPQGSAGFTRTRFCEGAAGNRYETIVSSTVVEGVSYSIALFVHSGNPGCYTAGSIVLFDRGGLLAILEQMIETLCIWPSSTQGGVAFRSGSLQAGTVR